MTALILLCVAMLYTGVVLGRPHGYVITALALIALLMLVAGWPHSVRW